MSLPLDIPVVMAGNNHESFGMTLGDSASTAAGFGRQG